MWRRLNRSLAGNALCATAAFVATVLVPQPNVPVEAQVAHPPPPPDAKQFDQPPTSNTLVWVGPRIISFPVQCWRLEPSAPKKPVGGVHGWQRKSAFVSFSATESQGRDIRFRQQLPLRSFAGGGASHSLTERDLPEGFFVAFRGHPVWRVTSVKYPSPRPRFMENSRTEGPAMRIDIEFRHEPTAGECYMYGAVWMAKQAR
jgi:hypothetical protein